MCYDMLSRRGIERTSQEGTLTLREEWAGWLATEEETRLLCCVYMLQCIHFFFTGIPTDFSLFDISQQVPCPSRIWYSTDIKDWKSKQMELQAVRLQPEASEGARTPETDSDPFLSKINLLALYVNEKNLERQQHTSRRVIKSFGSHLRAMSPRISNAPVRHSFIEDKNASIDNPLLDESIDHIVFLTREPGRCHGSLPHILAILRCISLRTLFAGTGWQTDTTQMTEMKTKFREFLERDGPQSRKCLWHAACIFKSVQTTRHLACYDMFSVGVATCYIILYMELRRMEFPSSQTISDAYLGSCAAAAPPRRIVRLDQISNREDVQHWVRSGGDTDIHLTNVGILRGPDSLARFLRATENALLRQVAWNAFSRAWARTTAQHIHGEKPTVHTDDYNEAKESKS